MTGTSHAALTVARGRLAFQRELATTPGRLRLAAVLLALGATVFGAVAAHAAEMRRQAVASIATTEPLVLSALGLSASLSDTQGIAAFSIAGGAEPADQNSHDDALLRAGASVARLAGAVRTSAAGVAFRRIVQTLTVYVGRDVNARVNSRQGLPVGSSYLRLSSSTMRNELLPAADALYRTEARSLGAHYHAGISRWDMFGVAVAGCAMLALLTGTQVYSARATRRILNPRLATASAVLVALMVWSLGAFAVQRQRLMHAQRTGSEPVELLASARSLASRAEARESVALARGVREGHSQLGGGDIAFHDLVRPIGRGRAGPAIGSGGLLERAAIAGGRRREIDRIYAAYRTYLTAHAVVVRQARRGNFKTAVKLAAVGDGKTPSAKDAATTLNHLLDRELRIAQGRFQDTVARAASALRGLALGIPLVTMLCALLALLGVHQRLKEYR